MKEFKFNLGTILFGICAVLFLVQGNFTAAFIFTLVAFATYESIAMIRVFEYKNGKATWFPKSDKDEHHG